MKWTAALLIILANTAHAGIFQCSPGVFTDKPCEGGKAVAVMQTGNPAAAGAKINYDFRQTTYPVHGGDYRSAFNAMKAMGKFNAWAKWNASYTYNRSQTDKACTMADLVINVSGEIQMPEWVEKGRAPRQDQSWWNEGQRQLQIHEDGHIQHGKDFAILLREQLLGLSSPDCKILDQIASAALYRLEANLRKLDEDYDRLTMHGPRQFNHD
jgi:hypothetical protein